MLAELKNEWDKQAAWIKQSVDENKRAENKKRKDMELAVKYDQWRKS